MEYVQILMFCLSILPQFSQSKIRDPRKGGEQGSISSRIVIVLPEVQDTIRQKISISFIKLSPNVFL